MEVLEALDLDPDPFAAFARWFGDAQRANAPQPEAMALATASPDGRPSVRMVLLRGLEPDAFTFFTNYESRKSTDLIANPYAALLFHWDILERQVRIEGVVERASELESDRYFASRPYESRLGAWASPQSRPIESRKEILDAVEALRARWPEGGPVPRPPHWGGFVLRPERFEFWQGRKSRLHDRAVCTRTSGGQWTWVRLGP